MSDIDRAELRRLLDEAETPWTIEQTTPNMDGPNWLIRREGKPGIIISAHEYGFHGRGELIVAAVNALPDLLDALEKAEGHRDSLAATLIEVQREKLAVEAARDRYGHAHKACHEQRDAAWAAIERVRELHTPMDVDVLQSDCAAEDCEHEDECPTIERTVCKACYILGESIDIYCYERGGIEYVYCPCPTIQVLDGGESA